MGSEQELQAIESILEELRPSIQMDGGDIEFVSLIDGVVSVRLQGARSSFEPLMITIEERLKEEIPDVVEVIKVD